MLTYILLILVAVFGSLAGFLAYERYYQKSQANQSFLYVEALRDLLDGQQEAAFTKLRQVVATDSSNLDAYLRLGQILREHNRPDRALQVHKDLTLRGRLTKAEKADILHQLALDYLALKEPNTAREALEELVSIDATDHWAHTQLLRLLEEIEDWDAAYDLAVVVLKLESNKSKKPLAKYKYLASQQLLKQREYHKARILLKEAIGLDPTFVDAYLSIGDSYQVEKRFEDAVTFWSKLITSVPEKGHLVIDRLKKTLFELGRFGDIMEICTKILKHDPHNLLARQTVAEFYQKKGELDSAREILEQIVEDAPNHLPSILELIANYLEKGDRRKVDELFRSLEKRNQKETVSTLLADASPTGN